MYIQKLVLKGYIRLQLCLIDSLEWTPQSHLMLILGRNGSGKSSIMDELTPVPAEKNQFRVGGRKEIYIEHRGSLFVLVSVYDGGSGKHSFTKDGEELNPGGTMAVMKELVWAFFKLNRNTHEVLTGVQRFSRMSTNARRDWLTRLIPVSMDYAFDRFKYVKGLHRDQQGVIKHLTKRMTQENVDLHDDAQIAKHKARLDELTGQLNKLFVEKRGSTRARFSSNTEATSKLTNLLDRGRQWLKLYPRLETETTVRCEQDYLDLVAGLSETIARHDSVISHMVEELHGLETQEGNPKEALSKEEISELEQLIAKQYTELDQLETTLNNYRGYFPLVDFDIQDNANAKLDGLFHRWFSLLTSFPNNEDGRFSTGAARQAKEELGQCKKELAGIESSTYVKQRRIATIKGCDSIICPSCDHTFKPGVDPQEAVRLEGEIAALHERVKELEAFIKERESYLEQFQEYSGYVFNFRSLAQDYSEFDSLWMFCAEHRVMFVSPAKHSTDAIQWNDAMVVKIRHHRLREQQRSNQNRLEKALAYNQDALGFVAEKRKVLEADIEEKTHVATDVKRELNTLKQSGNRVRQFEADIHQLIGEFEQFYEDIKAQVEHLVQRGIEEEIKALQVETGLVRHELNQLELLEQRLHLMEKEHKEAVELHQSLGVLVKALSSTDGLIGRYLGSFMQAMVGLMNSVIQEIWTYPLEVLPSKIDKEGLDYTFPLNVNNGAVIAPDVGRGSSSQCDIVDFAFKLLAMKFLGFDDYPLYLDEFGNTFDEQHRNNLVPFLVQLVELNQVQQIFYVSHFSSIHGAFNQAEFCVVDPTNITVPARYNENVIMQ